MINIITKALNSFTKALNIITKILDSMTKVLNIVTKALDFMKNRLKSCLENRLKSYLESTIKPSRGCIYCILRHHSKSVSRHFATFCVRRGIGKGPA
ncbi:hypothetical protein HHX47_DHR4000440 [Lentinula edodes]|nr:hypothetical protein HHX47_DHR4000440 [Lentinula edodes]